MAETRIMFVKLILFITIVMLALNLESSDCHLHKLKAQFCPFADNGCQYGLAQSFVRLALLLEFLLATL